LAACDCHRTTGIVSEPEKPLASCEEHKVGAHTEVN
jgi:hypothetical protein